MITHKGLENLLDKSQFELEERMEFMAAYYHRVTAIIHSVPLGKTPMTATHLKVAIQLIETSRRIEDPRFLAILDIFKDELDKMQPHSRRANTQQALQQAQEELKKAQAENEQLRNDLAKAQAENEQLRKELQQAQTLIHQLQTQPLSKQLKKLTEMAQQLENELELEQAARARAEAAVNQTSDGHTTIIHAQHVSLTDIHHNDNNNTHIKS